MPSLHQLQHDLGVFLVSAVKDLSKSIEHLEKARSEYRAAMLWLRNASTKLDDPDASKQLNKFREVRIVKPCDIGIFFRDKKCPQSISNNHY